jgi:hypothetical protein
MALLASPSTYNTTVETSANEGTPLQWARPNPEPVTM